jgi:DNA-binding NarL/FixJ family response regulator
MSRRQPFETVLIAKNVLIREGIARILRAENFRILASVSCSDDLSIIPQAQQLFLIVHTGDDFDLAVEQIGFLKDRHPGGRIAIVADHYRPGELASAFRAGANGYFVDVMTCDVFIKSLELVMMGETIFPPAFLSFVLDSEGEHSSATAPSDEGKNEVILLTADAIAPHLSPREKSILRCLVEGDSNKCIARKVDIAEATVKVHVKAILRKIRVQNRTQAAIWGMNNAILTQSANGASLPSTANVSMQLPKSA